MEIRYPKLDKLAMIVVHTSKKLRQYFQAHSIIIRIKFSLWKILQRPKTSERLVQWSVQLGEFDISYESRQQIKAQALADFIQEMTMEGDSTSLVHLEWSLYIDGTSGSQDSGAGIILVGPNKIRIKYAVKLKYNATNNAVEYEALITGLKLAIEVRTENLKVYSDSQLVVNQVKDAYQVKEPSIVKYMQKAKHLLKKLEQEGG